MQCMALVREAECLLVLRRCNTWRSQGRDEAFDHEARAQVLNLLNLRSLICKAHPSSLVAPLLSPPSSRLFLSRRFL